MLYDASRIGNATGELLQARHWQALGAVSRPPGGRGDAYFIEADGQSWVLRHYRRGGWIARWSQDSYLWTGEARTRPFREWRLLDDMHRSGLPVPAPVAAGYRRHGLSYTGDLITERIEDALPLSALLARGALAPESWQAVGRCIRRFHDAGVWHADLNAHNILLRAADGAVFLIDFDRGRRRAPGAWANKNLQRLRRSLDKVMRTVPQGHFCDADWDALMRGYTTEFSRSRA